MTQKRNAKLRRPGRSQIILRAFLLLFFLVTLAGPLTALFLTMAESDVAGGVSGPVFSRALGNSLRVSALTSLLSVGIALLLALCQQRARVPGAALFRLFFLLPMLVPSVSLGSGLVMLFGRNGILTRLFSLPFSIYGFHGVLLGELLYTVPILFLLFCDALSQEDFTCHEAAKALKIPPFARFVSLTLPALKGSLLAGAFLAFNLSIADYGVPLAVGGKFPTLATILYSEVAGKLDFGTGSVIGVLLLLPAFFAFLLDGARQRGTGQGFVTLSYRKEKAPGRDLAAFSLSAFFGLLFALPFAAFLCLAFVEDYPLNLSLTLTHLLAVFQGKSARYLAHSLGISAGAGLLGCLLAFPAAYGAVRRPSPASRMLHLLALFPMAVPGMVLGLSFLLFFRKTPLYGSFAILVLANTLHFFSTPYLMLCHTMEEQNDNLEDVGKTLGIPERQLLLAVFLPACLPTLITMFSYFFVNSMVTISAVSFLSASGTRPLSLLVTQYADQLNLEGAAALSFLLLLLNLLCRGAASLLSRRGKAGKG